MFQFTESIAIASRPDEIWERLVDIEKWWPPSNPEHIGIDVRYAGKPIDEGTEIHFEERVGGIKGKASGLITKWIPEREATWEGEAIYRYCGISRDYNPIHFDARFAKARNFSAPICQGLLSASLVTEIGGQIGWLASAMNFRFKGPVYVGETITCNWVTETISLLRIDSLANKPRPSVLLILISVFVERYDETFLLGNSVMFIVFLIH